MNKLAASLAVGLTVLVACSSPPKETTPALTPQTAATLLQMDSKSKNWLEHVKKENPACVYKVELPDQSNHPTVIDVEHVISCGAQPAPRSLNATVTYSYDKAAGHWVISRFAS